MGDREGRGSVGLRLWPPHARVHDKGPEHLIWSESISTKRYSPMPTLMHHTDLRERLLLRLTGALRPWPSSGRGSATVLTGGNIELPPSLLARRVAAADSAKLAIAFQLLDLWCGKVWEVHTSSPKVYPGCNAASLPPAAPLTCGCPPLPASHPCSPPHLWLSTSPCQSPLLPASPVAVHLSLPVTPAAPLTCSCPYLPASHPCSPPHLWLSTSPCQSPLILR